MRSSTKIFSQNNSTRMTARPLTLKEVLQLRDGMNITKASNPNYPYQTQLLPTHEGILLALN